VSRTPQRPKATGSGGHRRVSDSPLEIVRAPAGDFTTATLRFVDELERAMANTILTIVDPRALRHHWGSTSSTPERAWGWKGRLRSGRTPRLTSDPYGVAEPEPVGRDKVPGGVGDRTNRRARAPLRRADRCAATWRCRAMFAAATGAAHATARAAHTGRTSGRVSTASSSTRTGTPKTRHLNDNLNPEMEDGADNATSLPRTPCSRRRTGDPIAILVVRYHDQ